MAGTEIYEIASKSRCGRVTVYYDKEKIIGHFKTNETELHLSSISNYWTFIAGGSSLKLKGNQINKIEFGRTL